MSEQKEIMDQMLQSNDDKKHVVELESKVKKANEQMKNMYTEMVTLRKEFDRKEHDYEKLMKRVSQVERENVKLR